MTRDKTPDSGATDSHRQQGDANPADETSSAPAASASGADAATSEVAPPPEPLTPERMQAENRRNDLFILAGVVLIAFLHGWFKIADPSVWIHLKSGWFIDQRGVGSQDPLSYASTGKPWVNVHWLFDWGLYQAELAETRGRALALADDYERLLRARLSPNLDATGQEVSKPLPEADRATTEQAIAALRRAAQSRDTQQMRFEAEHLSAAAKQIGLQPPTTPPSSLGSDEPSYTEIRRYASPGGPAMIDLIVPVAIKAVLLALLAGALLRVRHPGPTAWWTAVVTVVAVVSMSDRFLLAPDIVGLVLLAVVFLLLHASGSERGWAWLLVPGLALVSALWVNVDSLFPLAIVVPAIVLVGDALGGLRGSAGEGASPPDSGPRPKILALAIGLSMLATLANPYGIRAWTVPYEWTRQWFAESDSVSSLDPSLASPLRNFGWASSIGMLVANGLMVLAVLSCVLNWRVMRVSRAVTLLFFLGLAAVAHRFVAPASLAAGVVLALNGQEWFLRRFGTETRITRGWLIWSQGGRALTVLGLVAVAFAIRTGWLAPGKASEFGYGMQWVRFDLDTAQFLRQARLKGVCFNTTPAQGNLLLWSNYSLDNLQGQQMFVDGRLLLDPQGYADFNALRVGLRDEDADTVQPLLEKYNITHVALNISLWADRVTFYQTYGALSQSERWKLVHLDAASAVFGRLDLPEGHALANDRRWFNEHAFDPAALVFRQDDERLPEPLPPVTAPNFVDWIWRTRRIPTASTILANHYLNHQLAAGYKREGLPPNVYFAPPENCFLAIRAARRGLATQQITAQGYLALSNAYYYLGTIEREELLAANVTNMEAKELRGLQHLAALNQLVTAQPDNLDGHVQLARRYTEENFRDLALKHIEAAIEIGSDPDQKAGMIVFRDELKDQIEKARSDLDAAASQLTVPTARASFLLRRGCPNLAIEELTQAIDLQLVNIEGMLFLANLYIRTGQPGDPDRGAESVLQRLDREAKDHNMTSPPGLRPGAWEELWAVVKLMQGDYEHARIFLEDAIAKTRHAIGSDALASVSDDLLQGSLMPTISMQTNLTEDADRQAQLEFRLGLLQLEAGEPKEAARHFKQALAVQNEAAFRPVAGFYLEKITGEKLPPLPARASDEPEAADKKDKGRAGKPDVKRTESGKASIVAPK